jgi:hypothetical protein
LFQELLHGSVLDHDVIREMEDILDPWMGQPFFSVQNPA